MKQISDSDYKYLLKLLPLLYKISGLNLREENTVRQAKLVLKKWRKKDLI